MENNRKTGKGFMKGKLAMSFYRATKPSSTVQPYATTSKVVKNTTSNQNVAPLASSSVGFIVNQEKVSPQANQQVAYLITQNTATCNQFDKLYGVVVDEGVDAKAASYISCVQERFKLEQVKSE